MMLYIENLFVNVGPNQVLDGFNLHVKQGEVHIIMGPNGAGKSTLASVLVRHPNYQVTSGSVRFRGQDLLTLKPEDCAALGIFLAFQYPIAIPGVSMASFLRTALNQIREKNNLPAMDTASFLQLLKTQMKRLNMDESWINRSLNEGCSGGERKKNEILQMAVLEPKLSVLDEIDSGLDIDALKMVSQGINRIRSADNAFILITHYPRLAHCIAPDFVHVLYAGKIIQSGDRMLAQHIEEYGYEDIVKGHKL